MPKYKVTVTYQGSVDILIDAENEEAAKGEGYIQFENVPAMEIESNIFDVSATAYEVDEEDEDDT